jgi:hypothetical protein
MTISHCDHDICIHSRRDERCGCGCDECTDGYALWLLRAWKHPVGTRVIVQLDSGEELETITRSEPWLVGRDRPVILLAGLTGGYALERVRVPETGGAS